ncbi:MAG: hypothetical protein ACI4OZ_02200, partial [Akkermansia sp.]
QYISPFLSEKNLQNRLIDVSLSKACHVSSQMNEARHFGTAFSPFSRSERCHPVCTEFRK